MKFGSNPVGYGLALLLFAMTVAADDQPRSDRPSFSASQTVTQHAIVESVDLETREVVLETVEGQVISLVAGEEVRNLAQVDVGDIVTTEYVETLTIELYSSEEDVPAEQALEALARADEGLKPGMKAVDTIISVATVESIDIESNTFRLRDAEGNVEEYSARHPQYLELAEVGDRVVTTIRNSIAVSVTEAGAE